MPQFAFPERFRMLRSRSQLTQDEVAERVGVSQNAIGSWERREASPPAAHLPTICRLFDVSADYLVGTSEFPHGLAPDSWLIDLDEYEAGRPGKVWAAKVPRRMRIVDFAELERLRATQGKKGKN